MPCPSGGAAAAAPQPSRGAAAGEGLSPALPAAGPAEPEQQEELAFTGAPGLCCGFISCGIFVGNWFCFSEHHQHEEEEDEEEEGTHPASTWIWNQKLWDVVWVSDGISPPGATVGVLPPPWTRSRVRHRAGNPGPQMPPGTAGFPLQVGFVLIQGMERTRVLSSLFLTLQFCLDRNLKQKKSPKPKPTPSICHTRNQP